MNRAGRNSKFAVCCAAWTVSLGAAAVHGGPARPLPAVVAANEPDRLTVLAQAQKPPAELRTADIFGQPGRPVSLNIGVLNASTADQLYIFTGIPEGFTLNPGGYVGKFWAVNSKVLSSLTLTAPDGFTGSFTVSVARRPDASAPTVSASFKVTIGQPATTATVATVAPAAPRPDAPKAPPAKAARKANPNEAAYLARARAVLQSGDISAARAVFENLALQGSAAAAMALGETYDPVMLRTLVIKGLEADPEKARKWYLKAEELGGSDARRRLNELAGR